MPINTGEKQYDQGVICVRALVDVQGVTIARIRFPRDDQESPSVSFGGPANHLPAELKQRSAGRLFPFPFSCVGRFSGNDPVMPRIMRNRRNCRLRYPSAKVVSIRTKRRPKEFHCASRITDCNIFFSYSFFTPFDDQ